MMIYVLLPSYFICLGSFYWAIVKFFKIENQGASLGKKIISTMGGITSVAAVVAVVNSVDLNWIRLVIAVAFYGLSLAIFWSAIRTVKIQRLDFAFSDKKPVFFIFSGPYKFIRHPLYSSYTICWFATAFASGQIFMWVLAFGMFGIYLKAALYEESQFLTSDFKSQYLEYKNRTARFFPIFCFLRVKK